MCESLHVAVRMYINYNFFTFIFAVLSPQEFATYAICIVVLVILQTWKIIWTWHRPKTVLQWFSSTSTS